MHRTCWRRTFGLAWRLTPVSLTIVLSVTGCFQSGPPITKVSGKVTFQGQPVTEGVVNFVSESGFGVRATLGTDGSYRLRSHHGNGIPLDNYKVSISPPPFDPVPLDLSQPPPKRPEYPNIPQAYRSLQTSGLVAQVGAKANVFDFNMKP